MCYLSFPLKALNNILDLLILLDMSIQTVMFISLGSSRKPFSTGCKFYPQTRAGFSKARWSFVSCTWWRLKGHVSLTYSFGQRGASVWLLAVYEGVGSPVEWWGGIISINPTSNLAPGVISFGLQRHRRQSHVLVPIKVTRATGTSQLSAVITSRAVVMSPDNPLKPMHCRWAGLR